MQLLYCVITSTAVLGWCHVRIPDKQGDTGYPVHFFSLPLRQLKWGINELVLYLVPARHKKEKTTKSRESNGAVVTAHPPMPNYMNDNMTCVAHANLYVLAKDFGNSRVELASSRLPN